MCSSRSILLVVDVSASVQMAPRIFLFNALTVPCHDSSISKQNNLTFFVQIFPSPKNHIFPSPVCTAKLKLLKNVGTSNNLSHDKHYYGRMSICGTISSYSLNLLLFTQGTVLKHSKYLIINVL